MNDVSVMDILERLLSRWWLLAALIITGGLLGWAASSSRPPVYEARASLVVTQSTNTGWNTNANEASLQLSNVAAIVSSNVLGPGLIEELDLPGVTPEDMTLERRESVWDFVVRSTDPQAAADLANAWIDRAYAALEDSIAHARTAKELDDELDILRSCAKYGTAEACAGVADRQNLAAQISSLQIEQNKEKNAGQGINTELLFRIESHASTPVKPAAHGTGTLVLAGALAGLLIGLLAFTIRPKVSIRKQS